MQTFSEDQVGAIIKAVDFAARRHKSQRRKGTDARPYINHPLGVALLLWEKGGVRESHTIVAAVLHDIVEDTETALDEITEEFGGRVAGIVDEVTDDKSLPKAQRKNLQIEHAEHMSPEAALIKLADKIYNVTDILNNPPADWSASRKQEYLEWAQSVVEQLPISYNPLRTLFETLVNEGFAEMKN